MTVQNEHTQFPVSSATGVQTLTPSASVQNLNVRAHAIGNTMRQSPWCRDRTAIASQSNEIVSQS